LKIVPKSEYIDFHSYWNASTTLGLGLGPVLCSVFLVFALGTWWVIPSDIQDLIDIKSVQDAEPDEASPQTTTAKEASSGTWVNKHVWVADAVFGQVRAGVVSSLEVASAMLMERFFELSAREIGLIVGATFVVGWMSMELLRALRKCEILTDPALVCALAATSLLSTSLFFDWHVWQESHWGFWVIVTADVWIFSTIFTANSIADGLCSAYAVPGTWYSQENALICNGLQNTVGRFAGPPVSRYLIDVGGQNAYALAQTFICTVPLSAGLVMWKAIRTRSLGPME